MAGQEIFLLERECAFAFLIVALAQVKKAAALANARLGTTTDSAYESMEILPLGPVILVHQLLRGALGPLKEGMQYIDRVFCR